ncbi:hypothetical protein NI385_18020 [Vibrio parahaemolyticus]|nr:hypothetical protein NI385_18020 [Vibrio parahaemolyticus]
MEDRKLDKDDIGHHLFHLADRIIGLLYLVVWLVAFIVIGLLIFYGYLIFNPEADVLGGQQQLQILIVNLWDKVGGYLASFVRLLAPMFVLIFALGVLHRLGKQGASPFNLEKLLADLPSALALIIIITICLLPLSGIGVPDVLSNIALVVVGFYFGKRELDGNDS